MGNNDTIAQATSAEIEDSQEIATPQEKRLSDNNTISTNGYSPDIVMTPGERLYEQGRLVRVIYESALDNASRYATDAKIARDQKPVNLNDYPARFAGISREILDLRDKITAINDTWATVMLRHKQDIAAQTIKAPNGRGIEVEKPAYPNEEARETELMARMAALDGWSLSMLRVAAMERVIQRLEILRQEIADDFEVVRLRMERETAATYRAFPRAA
jgi:hypothetical protein